MINISKNRCIGCGICESNCVVEAVSVNKKLGIAEIYRDKCTNCGLCIENYPQNAIKDIKEECIFAFGTDNKKEIKSDGHVGMSKYFQIWKYSDGKMAF